MIRKHFPHIFPTIFLHSSVFLMILFLSSHFLLDGSRLTSFPTTFSASVSAPPPMEAVSELWASSLATAAHRALEAMAAGAALQRKGISPVAASLLVLLLAAATPAGMALSSVVPAGSAAAAAGRAVAPFAAAAAAGTVLHVAVFVLLQVSSE